MESGGDNLAATFSPELADLTVYVIDTKVEQLSPESIVAINDLGPGGETWTLASLTYAKGRLYAHNMKEVICIEAPAAK